MNAEQIYHKLQEIAERNYVHSDQMVEIAKWIEAEFEHRPSHIPKGEYKVVLRGSPEVEELDCAKCKYYEGQIFHDKMWCRDCQQKNKFTPMDTCPICYGKGGFIVGGSFGGHSAMVRCSCKDNNLTK